eukprot:NODE_49_length_27162_cov_0.380039.p14 type:complete len:111 gc:universal NODE_49_length_27162_cov_0.380039:4478-4146(-)
MALKLISALSGAMAVAAGAFGEHALRNRLPASKINSFKVAANYQMIHSGMALLAYNMNYPIAAKLFICGTCLFSGSIYILVLNDGMKFMGPVTPIGGILIISGWLALAFA